MGLPAPVKYGKGKEISTAADVLEELAEEHEIARKVLEYRQLTKLKGTYVDALPSADRPGTGRVHTTFNQIGAATGRLSSSNPNLQNIPIRTELGREIRAAFIPREGWRLMVADYSQIELRLLAHMSQRSGAGGGVPQRRGHPHAHRSRSFGVPPLMVTPDMRRNAKAVNFGIVYGSDAVRAGRSARHRAEGGRDGTSSATSSGTPACASSSTRPSPRSAQTGVAQTLLGPRAADSRYEQPKSQRARIRRADRGQHAAAGHGGGPHQDGDDPDRQRLLERGMQAKMLLQVHDELVFEAPPEESNDLKTLVKSEMERVYPLAVPLLVDIGIGDNWRDAK